MSYTEQEKQEALALYDELGSISKVINKLGFPSRQNMYTWIRKRNVEQKKEKRRIVLILLNIEDIHLWKLN